MRAHPFVPIAALVLIASALAPVALANHAQGSGPRSLGGATVPPQPALVTIEAEQFHDKPVGALSDEPGATGGKAWRIEKYGVISTPITIPTTGVVWLEVRAKGYHPVGLRNPHMHPVINGEQRGEWDVNATWQIYRQSIPLLAGTHTLAIDNFNNYHAPADDRTLVVDWVRVSRPTLEGVPIATGSAPLVIDAPEIHAAGTGERQQSADARGGTQWLMWGVGCFVEAISFLPGGDYAMKARLRGNEPGGVGSHVEVLLDGKMIEEFFAGDAWMERAITLTVWEGAHVVEICYDNDRGGEQKRNLWLDDIQITRVAGSPEPATPTQPTPGPRNISYAPPTQDKDRPPQQPPTSPDPDLETPVPGLVAGVGALGVAATFLRRRLR